MNDSAARSPGETGDDQARVAARRRRLLAAVFGDVLPDGTRDDRPEGDREGRQGGTGDDWLKDQVPPHHG